MPDLISVTPKRRPPLDPEFLPASLWHRAYRARVAASPASEPLAIALERKDGSVSTFETRTLPHEGKNAAINHFYVERVVKFLLWQRGGWRITIAGNPALAQDIAARYTPEGERAFDQNLMGELVYGAPMQVVSVPYDQAPAPHETSLALGRNLDGCRIGFDLGGSDRKCAAVVDGEVVFTEEVRWDPYFQADPQYHYDGIHHTLRRAAAHLPRVDAIGGSSAGVYVNNEIRVASLFRGVPRDVFVERVQGMFFELQRAWGGVPFVVVNDGEVTALAGSMALDDASVLGVSMGTSQAGGYVNPRGRITDWLNELAFAPVDYRPQGPMDEWSKDGGVGAQYFSQQAVSRLLPAAGIDVAYGMPLAERLVHVQNLMAAGDPRAARIYESIGVYLGYAVAHYAEFYDLRHVLVLGRVLSGDGGELLLTTARETLREEFPGISEAVGMHVPGEKDKRHGQAVAAASLPALR